MILQVSTTKKNAYLQLRETGTGARQVPRLQPHAAANFKLAQHRRLERENRQLPARRNAGDSERRAAQPSKTFQAGTGVNV